MIWTTPQVIDFACSGLSPFGRRKTVPNPPLFSRKSLILLVEMRGAQGRN
jgi:hypothetical protein